MQEQTNYRGTETGKGTTSFGARKLSGCLSKEQKDEYIKSLVEKGLCGFAFAVDENGAALIAK